MITEQDLCDTIIRISQDQRKLENRMLNAMVRAYECKTKIEKVKADHEKIMKELEREVNSNGKKERSALAQI